MPAASAGDNNGNGRKSVSNVELGIKLDNLTGIVNANTGKLDTAASERRQIEKSVSSIKDDLIEKIHAHDIKLALIEPVIGDIIDAKRAVVRQVIVMLFGIAGGISGIVALIMNLTK